MGLSQYEKEKLVAFSNIQLDRNQTEIIIGRKLENSEWKKINRDYKKIFSALARQDANVGKRKNRLKEITRKSSKGNIRQARLLRDTDNTDEDYYFIKSLHKKQKDKLKIHLLRTYKTKSLTQLSPTGKYLVKLICLM